MNADMKHKSPAVTEAEPITVEDLKRRAEEIGDLAASVSRRVADKVVQQSATRKMLVVVGVVLAAASLAYFAGRRAVLHSLDSAE
ncbi:MAG: hypothetical protein HGA39_06570 [Coriobacteriia bacterium]|nr:hypothetical protein [Coriobacteriia bacterium]